VRCDQFLKTDFAIVLWCITNDLAGIGNAPEGVRIATNAVENLKRNSLLVTNIGGFDTFDKQLLQIEVANIDGQGAPYTAQITQLTVGQIILARAADANLHIF